MSPDTLPIEAPTRREQIAQVAARAFCRFGYGSASMREIAAEIGITPAALYHHFRNKEEILFEVIAAYTDDLLAMLRQEFAEGPDPASALRRALLAHILLLETRQVETRLVIDEKKHLSPPHLKRIVQREREVFGLYRDAVNGIIAAGEARELDAAVVTFALFGIVNYFYQWFRPGGALTLRQAAEQSIALVFGGLLDPSAGGVPERRAAKKTRTR